MAQSVHGRPWVVAEQLMAGGGVGGEAARRALEQAALDAAARVEGDGAPSATAQRGRRALGEERRLRVLHLFAGPSRDDSLAAEFEARGWETVEVDVLQGQDLLRGKHYRTLLQRARDAEFDLCSATFGTHRLPASILARRHALPCCTLSPGSSSACASSTSLTLSRLGIIVLLTSTRRAAR